MPKVFLIEASQPDSVPDEQRSLFISSVVSMFHQRAAKDHLMDMMLRVNRHVKIDLKMRQPWQVCTLTKKVFFERKKMAQTKTV